MSIPPMTPLMTGGIILFLVVFMILFLFAVHVMRTNHHRRYGRSSHGSSSILPILNWVIKMLLRIGIRITMLGPMMLLTVRGRKTGEPRTLPVDVYERDGRHFLIATHGEGNWVRNLRVARTGILSLGWHHQTLTAVELAPEEAGLVIKDILGPLLASQGIRGNALRQHLGVRANSSLNDFIAVAKNHPVFEFYSPARSSSVREEQVPKSVPEKSGHLGQTVGILFLAIATLRARVFTFSPDALGIIADQLGYVTLAAFGFVLLKSSSREAVESIPTNAPAEVSA